MEKSISVIYGWCMKFSLDNGSQEEVNNKTGWEEYTPLGIHNTVVEKCRDSRLERELHCDKEFKKFLSFLILFIKLLNIR